MNCTVGSKTQSFRMQQDLITLEFSGLFPGKEYIAQCQTRNRTSIALNVFTKGFLKDITFLPVQDTTPNINLYLELGWEESVGCALFSDLAVNVNQSDVGSIRDGTFAGVLWNSTRPVDPFLVRPGIAPLQLKITDPALAFNTVYRLYCAAGNQLSAPVLVHTRGFYCTMFAAFLRSSRLLT